MNILTELFAHIRHSIHSLRAGLLGHQLITMSEKKKGDLFYKTQHVECECGKVFATVKEK
jgi:hypothetical protein